MTSLELLLSPFDATPAGLRHAAALADELDIGGLWTMDHLAGPVHVTRRTVLECLSSLSIIVEATTRATVGPMVLNPVARHPVVLAQALATLDQAAGPGRLRVGIGAGGGAGVYGDELAWAGLINHDAATRRARVRETIELLDHVWSGSDGAWSGGLYSIAGSNGFLVPTTKPPIIVAGYGPKMAELAGRHADGFNTAATSANLESLVTIARQARAGRIGAERPMRITTYAVFEPVWLDADSAERRRLDAAGVDAHLVVLPAPYDQGLVREIAAANDLGATAQ